MICNITQIKNSFIARPGSFSQEFGGEGGELNRQDDLLLRRGSLAAVPAVQITPGDGQ